MTKLRAPSFVEWFCIYLLYIHSGPLIPLKFTDVLGLAWCSGRALLSFRVVKFRHYPFFPEQLTNFYVHIFPSFSGLQWRLLKPLQLFIQLDFPFFQLLSCFLPAKIDITTCINFLSSFNNLSQAIVLTLLKQ